MTSQGASDGRNCTYEGTFSDDGLSVKGKYYFNGGRDYPWEAKITQRVFAPGGMLFLLTYKNVTTDSGIVGFPPGTALEQVEAHGDSVTVRAGDQQFDIDKNVVTNDVYLARSAWEKDQRGQTALRTKARLDEDERIKKDLEVAEEREKQARAASLRSAVAQGSGFVANPLAGGAYGQTPRSSSAGGGFQGRDTSNAAEIERLKIAQRIQLQSQIDQLNGKLFAPRVNKGNWRDGREETEAREQRDALNKQLHELQ